jgi:hypothetical protein
MPSNVQIDASKITDWDSFHDCFSETLGFPDFYGSNLNAWIDCMTYVDDAGAGMTTVHVAPGEVLVLCISGMADFKKRCPEIYEALVECSAFVNFRRIETGRQAVLALSFHA